MFPSGVILKGVAEHMSSEVMQFYENLGFEESEIEDGLKALAYEFPGDESYALLTDENGEIPQNLKQRVIFAYYSAEGAFQWSIGFKNAYLLQNMWSEPETSEQKLAKMLAYLESKEM